jgi:hypothetical protein
VKKFLMLLWNAGGACALDEEDAKGWRRCALSPLSVKERAMADLRAAQQRIGVPIAVPQNPPRAQTHIETESIARDEREKGFFLAATHR